MPSSTSSSSVAQATILWRRNRTLRMEPAALALLLTAAVLGALLLVPHKQPKRRALEDDAVAAGTFQPADVVLVGDSHVRQGIVPSELSQALGGARVFSYAQPGTPLSPEFLESAAARLDPASPQRTLAIGVTLTTQKMSLRNLRAGFNAAPPVDAAAQAWVSKAWASRLQPFVSALQNPPLRVNQLHDDGWRERDFKERRDAHLTARAEQLALHASPFDQMMLDLNRAALAALEQRGVRVVLFTMPSDVEVIEPMVEAWAGMSALDYARAICPPHGQVVELTHLPAETYDGHHLHPDAAHRVTSELGAKMALPAATPPAGAASPPVAGGPPPR